MRMVASPPTELHGSYVHCLPSPSIPLLPQSQATDDLRKYMYDSVVPERQRRLLSRRKRQGDVLFGGGGILKDIFGVAYTTDVRGLNSKIIEAEDRLNIQVRWRRSFQEQTT